MNEINILKKFYHPNIIHIFDVFDEGDCLSIVMEYATEGDLYTVL